jgi:hypothetical protein
MNIIYVESIPVENPLKYGNVTLPKSATPIANYDSTTKVLTFNCNAVLRVSTLMGDPGVSRIVAGKNNLHLYVYLDGNIVIQNGLEIGGGIYKWKYYGLIDSEQFKKIENKKV